MQTAGLTDEEDVEEHEKALIWANMARPLSAGGGSKAAGLFVSVSTWLKSLHASFFIDYMPRRA